MQGKTMSGASNPSAPQHAAVEDAIALHAARPGGLMPLLHAVQERLGFIPPEALPRIADALNISRAEVHGVITFYHDFRTSPRGRHVVKLCRAEACQSMGGEALALHAQARLGTAFHHTSPDGVTLEPVYCLGDCACSPAMMIDGRLYGRVTPERFDRLVWALDKP
jgi:NADH:ubiquinone oxidoreductase subunit E